jgi:hypothetical protein
MSYFLDCVYDEEYQKDCEKLKKQYTPSNATSTKIDIVQSVDDEHKYVNTDSRSLYNSLLKKRYMLITQISSYLESFRKFNLSYSEDYTETFNNHISFIDNLIKSINELDEINYNINELIKLKIFSYEHTINIPFLNSFNVISTLEYIRFYKYYIKLIKNSKIYDSMNKEDLYKEVKYYKSWNKEDLYKVLNYYESCIIDLYL